MPNTITKKVFSTAPAVGSPLLVVEVVVVELSVLLVLVVVVVPSLTVRVNEIVSKLEAISTA